MLDRKTDVLHLESDDSAELRRALMNLPYEDRKIGVSLFNLAYRTKRDPLNNESLSLEQQVALREEEFSRAIHRAESQLLMSSPSLCITNGLVSVFLLWQSLLGSLLCFRPSQEPSGPDCLVMLSSFATTSKFISNAALHCPAQANFVASCPSRISALAAAVSGVIGQMVIA